MMSVKSSALPTKRKNQQENRPTTQNMRARLFACSLSLLLSVHLPSCLARSHAVTSVRRRGRSLSCAVADCMAL